MRILGIETSCDETGAAIIEAADEKIILLSNVLATSLHLHAQTGGIIPEKAAREQLKYILPIVERALLEAFSWKIGTKNSPPVDAIAVTYGPGLIGPLLVGVETARTLSYIWNIPLIPVNHLYGHIYANFIDRSINKEALFPALALVVSGGHTDLVLMQKHGNFTVIGGTRDDAAGEAFDKIGRLLGLSYPAGAEISRLAEKGDSKSYKLPRPMLGSNDFDFSFSGLKTAVLNLVKQNQWDFTNGAFAEKNHQLLCDLSASVQQAIIDVLVRKTINAAKEHDVRTVLLGGGVAANDLLRETLLQKANDQRLTTKVFAPQKFLCTDNAAMITAAAYFNKKQIPWQDIAADPELYF